MKESRAHTSKLARTRNTIVSNSSFHALSSSPLTLLLLKMTSLSISFCTLLAHFTRVKPPTDCSENICFGIQRFQSRQHKEREECRNSSETSTHVNEMIGNK